jgi:hypothetical protein
MARFIVVHKLADSAAGRDFQEMRAMRKQLFKLAETPDVQWLRGWWVYDSAKQICEYEAKDMESIRRALQESGMEQIMPALSIDEVMLSGPTDFPGEFSE